jgi:DNA-binding NarL/FixJ family response regulator
VRLAAACEGAWTPWLLAPEPTGLTRREREVATLAAAGLSSRSIAERLVLSKRTVDNHLSQVFAKLGLHSRTELPAALGRDDPS